MQIQTWQSPTSGVWHEGPPGSVSADLVLVFGSRLRMAQPELAQELAAAFPGAALAGCSTAGEIADVEVLDDALTVVAISFAHTTVRATSVVLEAASESRTAGAALAAALAGPELSHVFVLSEGLAVNGSALVDGLVAALPAGVGLTGGMAGDGADFGQTVVMDDQGVRGQLVRAIGLYGTRLRIGHASVGGWSPFGPERRITRAEGNVLYELDHQPALEVYRRYLGPHADALPMSGLRFPLTVRTGAEEPLVRTLLTVDEDAGSLTFAGDMPTGSIARLMNANREQLVDGAAEAAEACHAQMGDHSAELALLISCVGRKLILKQRIEEEVESTREVFGDNTVITGFYSYGEVCPQTSGGPARLHNQTMTITTFAEV